MKRAFLGSDVSKGYADIVILNEHQEQLCKSFRCMDNAAGHRKMFSEIDQVFEQQDVDVIYCGMESTGGYENNWYSALSSVQDDRIKVTRINPVRVYNESKVQMNRVVTDAIAAKTIAIHLSRHHKELLSHKQPDSEMASARKVYGTITQLQKHCTAMINHLEKLFYESIPELAPLCRYGFPKSLIRLLAQYPGKGALKRAKIKGLTKIRGISEKKALKIKAALKDSVGTDGDKFSKFAIKNAAEQILDTQAKIDSHKEFLAESFINEQVQLLEAIPGIGKASAVGFVIEIENAHRFESASSISSYFGLHPVFKISGDGSTKAKMSKQGRSSMRSLLFMAAKNVVQYDPYFKAIYQAKRQQGRNYHDAIGIIMHKLLRVIYGVLKSKEPYNSRIDQINHSKSKPKKVQRERELTKVQQELELMKASPCSGRSINKLKRTIETLKENLAKEKNPEKELVS